MEETVHRITVEMEEMGSLFHSRILLRRLDMVAVEEVKEEVGGLKEQEAEVPMEEVMVVVMVAQGLMVQVVEAVEVIIAGVLKEVLESLL